MLACEEMKVLCLWGLYTVGSDSRSLGADDKVIRYRDNSKKGGKHTTEWIAMTLF